MRSGNLLGLSSMSIENHFNSYLNIWFDADSASLFEKKYFGGGISIRTQNQEDKFLWTAIGS